MAITFQRRTGMDAQEGAAAPRGRVAGCTNCGGFQTCQNRESRQRWCLEQASRRPSGLVLFEAPIKPGALARGVQPIDQATDWGSRATHLSSDALELLFSIKGFVRMAWLQGDPDLLRSRRLLGTMKKKGDNAAFGAWHPPLHGTPLPNEWESVVAWGSQVWFDIEQRDNAPVLVAAVRDRTDGAWSLAKDLEAVLNSPAAQQFLGTPTRHAPTLTLANPTAATEPIRWAEVRARVSLGPFVTGLGLDVNDVPRNAFPNRPALTPRHNAGPIKAVLPAVRRPNEPTLPVAGVRGPLREAYRWLGWIQGDGGNDPSSDLFGDTDHGGRIAVSFGDASCLNLNPDDFRLAKLFFTSDTLNPMGGRERNGRIVGAFNPMQVRYHPGLAFDLVLRVRDPAPGELDRLRIALDLLHHGFFRVGRFRSRGFGRMRLSKPSHVQVVYDLKKWLGGEQDATTELSWTVGSLQADEQPHEAPQPVPQQIRAPAAAPLPAPADVEVTTDQKIQRAVFAALGNIAQWELAFKNHNLSPEQRTQAARALLDHPTAGPRIADAADRGKKWARGLQQVAKKA